MRTVIYMNGSSGKFKKRGAAPRDDLTPPADLSIPKWNGDCDG
ncbi:hypothetical protein N181_18745 [Sinorhizobium fredii USDA 205]|nr:hypothetical protein AOX55_00003041 [Sinorhizobium fredii CCBAU 25509]KSV87545.1 hypothetical protein N181_18745 [Sinorhizobium fredii USDA 205]